MKQILATLLISVVAVSQTADMRPAFKKRKARIGNANIVVEIADSEKKRAYGLMFIGKMPVNQGMLFIFDRPDFQSFWMKNTRIALDIGYFDEKLKLVEVLPMEPESLVSRSLKTYSSSKPVKYALEMNKGWFNDNKIKPGAVLKLLP